MSFSLRSSTEIECRKRDKIASVKCVQVVVKMLPGCSHDIRVKCHEDISKKWLPSMSAATRLWIYLSEAMLGMLEIKRRTYTKRCSDQCVSVPRAADGASLIAKNTLAICYAQFRAT